MNIRVICIRKFFYKFRRILLNGINYKINLDNPTVHNDDETYYIDKFNSYYGVLNELNKRGFNGSLNGKGGIRGLKALHKGDLITYTIESKIESYEMEGWSRGYGKLGCRNPECNVYQTIYYPGLEKYYRASITKDNLIIEYIDKPHEIEFLRYLMSILSHEVYLYIQ
jgi:hypothetical protein